MAKLEPHEFAKLLPLMSESELSPLTADIAARGVVEPVLLFKGKVIDGRNRVNACEELGIDPPTKEFKGSDADALALVYSKAVHRNMSDSQKAMAAANFLPYFEKYASSGGKSPKVELVPPGKSRKSRDFAGGLFGVSGRYVSDARRLKEANRELASEVMAGKTTLKRAVRMLNSKARRDELESKGRASPPVGDCEIVAANCITALEAVPARSFRLAFADGPYNQKIDYGAGEKADDLPPKQFLDNSRAWMNECHRVLTNDGSLWVLISSEWAAEFCLELKKRFTLRRWIGLYETFGQNCSDNFNRTLRHLFYCVKSEDNFVFNRDPFTRKSARQLVYGDGRAVPAGKLADDVWIIPRLVENARERVPGFPTQLPLELVEPIVLGCSEPGDCVFDPFVGSGTTALAACRNGRRFKGFEIVPANAKAADLRVRAAVADAAGKGKSREIAA